MAEDERRFCGFWQEFNVWFRAHMKEHGQRPRAHHVMEWYNQHATRVWNDADRPTFQEVRIHGKGIRDKEERRKYFREYRARKKGAKREPWEQDWAGDEGEGEGEEEDDDDDEDILARTRMASKRRRTADSADSNVSSDGSDKLALQHDDLHLSIEGLLQLQQQHQPAPKQLQQQQPPPKQLQQPEPPQAPQPAAQPQQPQAQQQQGASNPTMQALLQRQAELELELVMQRQLQAQQRLLLQALLPQAAGLPLLPPLPPPPPGAFPLLLQFEIATMQQQFLKQQQLSQLLHLQSKTEVQEQVAAPGPVVQVGVQVAVKKEEQV